MDNDQMKQIRKRLWLALDNLRNFSSIEDAILWVATLLYLRKNNALFLDTRSEKIIEAENEGLDVVFMLNLPGGSRLFCDRRALSCQNDLRTLLRKYLGGISNGDIVRNIVEFVMDLDNNKLSEIEFLSILDWTIEYGFTTNKIHHQPHEISVLVDRLLDSKVKTVFDPFGGLMDFATSMRNRCFVANEINYTIWEIGLFRLALAGIIDQTVFNNSNSLDLTCEKKYDAIVTLPPFGTKLRLPDSSSDLKVNAEEIALRYFGTLTNPEGQLIAVVPLSFLGVETLSKNLRKEITDNNWLDSIIYLPLNTFSNATILTAMVVLKKNRKQNDPVRIVDATDCYVKDKRTKSIDVDAITNLYDECNSTLTQAEIVEQNYTWELRWYIDQQKTVFNEGYETVLVKNILTQLSSFNKFEDTEGYVIGIKDLANDVYGYEKRPEDFCLEDDLRQTSKITEPVILLSMIREPKPTYCKASEQNPIFIKRDVCAYRITNETVHPGYLCLELSKRLKFYKGAGLPRFSKNQILNTRIEFPSLDGQRSIIEQNNLFEELHSEHQRTKYKEKDVQDYIAKIRKEDKESIRGRKHAIEQYLSDVSASWNVLNSFRKEKNGCLMDTDIVDEDYQMTVSGLFSSIDSKLNSALEQMETLLSDENEWEGLDLDQIEPSGFIHNYIIANNDVRFNFVQEGFDIEEYNRTLAEIELEYWAKLFFPSKVLKRVFENIIKNAVEYGFTDPQRKDYKVLFSIEYSDLDEWVIRIANNGEPVPDSLDPKKVFNLGYTTGMGKGHSGRGAYQVKQLMEMYGGEVRFVSTPDEEYTVTYVLTFKNKI